MKMPRYPWGLRSLYSGRPTVGWLMDLCEENYGCLMRLAPGLRLFEGRYLSQLEVAMDLHMEVLEQTPYTTLLHLTHYFSHEAGQQPDPDARLRVYHDSGQAEVIDLRQSAFLLHRGDRSTLEQKWKTNLFLSKWLSYCLGQGHAFHPAQRVDDLAGSRKKLVGSC
jgi:uncharacterized protein YqiB (DUF1249 family)